MTRWNSLFDGSAASSTTTASAADEAVPGAKRRGEHVEVVGQLVAEGSALARDSGARSMPRTTSGDGQAEDARAAAPDHDRSSQTAKMRRDAA